MADGTITLAEAEWMGTIQIAGIKIQGSFLVFSSSGGWAFLFGKPLLTAFKAVHDYSDDTITICDNSQHAILNNRINDPTHVHIMGMQTPTLDIKQLLNANSTPQQSQWERKTIMHMTMTIPT